MKKVLLVASNGGHLVQLLRLMPAFDAYELELVSTSSTPPSAMKDNAYYAVTDSNMDEKFKLLITMLQCFFVVLKSRPDVVVSTGAAPGLFCILWVRLFGGKAIWIDSIANTERLSLAGSVAAKLTKNCYSQWKDVAVNNGVKYLGAVI